METYVFKPFVLPEGYLMVRTPQTWRSFKNEIYADDPSGFKTRIEKLVDMLSIDIITCLNSHPAYTPESQVMILYRETGPKYYGEKLKVSARDLILCIKP